MLKTYAIISYILTPIQTTLSSSDVNAISENDIRHNT